MTKSNFQSSSPFAILNFEIRGLYIQSENILFAALIIVAPPDYKFYIANIDISTSLVNYKETFRKFDTMEL